MNTTPRPSLLVGAKYCLVAWAAIWAFYMLLRFTPLDIRVLPGAGPIMLVSLVVVLLAPIAAAGLSIAGIVREPRARTGWIVLGLSIVALFGQAILFMARGWM